MVVYRRSLNTTLELEISYGLTSSLVLTFKCEMCSCLNFASLGFSWHHAFCLGRPHFLTIILNVKTDLRTVFQYAFNLFFPNTLTVVYKLFFSWQFLIIFDRRSLIFIQNFQDAFSVWICRRKKEKTTWGSMT